jgi:hypothetical protein
VLGAYLNRMDVNTNPLYHRMGAELFYYPETYFTISLGSAHLIPVFKKEEWKPYLTKSAYSQYLTQKKLPLTIANEQAQWSEFIHQYRLAYVILHQSVGILERKQLRELYKYSLQENHGLECLYELK